MKFIKRLKKINKLYYTIADILTITNYSENSLYVILNRLVKQGELIRITSGIYILPEQYGEIERIANALYFPSYLSFDTALAKFGVISQLPYTLMFATPLKTKTIQLSNYKAEYKKIKKELFFGYTTNKEGLLIATPEKALFDIYYISSFGKMYFDFKSIDSTKVEIEKVKYMIKKYLNRDSIELNNTLLRP